MTRTQRLAKSLGIPELARRLGATQKNVAKWAKRLPKSLAKDPRFVETLRGIEVRHKAAKVARAARKPAKLSFVPKNRPAPKTVQRAGREEHRAMRESLELLKKTFPKGKIRTHVYKSGQVRGEIRVPVERVPLKEIILDFAENAMFKQGVWMSAGFTFPKGKPRGMTWQQYRESYPRRNKGAARVNMNPRKWKRSADLLTAAQVVGGNIQKKYGKPQEVIFTTAWNPSGKRESFRNPKRKGGK